MVLPRNKLVIVSVCLLSLACALQESSEVSTRQSRRVGRLDASQAFYYPPFAAGADHVLVRTKDGLIDSATYLRYLAARLGTRYLEDLAFDFVLAKECKARGLAKSAPLLARSTAARRLHESGRKQIDDPDGRAQRKFANEALRQLRIDALVKQRREADDTALRALFDRRYGVDGQRVKVRQILVSFSATRRRLEQAGKEVHQKTIVVAARTRVLKIRQEIRDGSSFADRLTQTDEQTAKRLLRDPAHKGQAGILAGYNYLRYGESFAKAVRALDVGSISSPVKTDTGFHIIELLERKVTRFKDVADALRREVGRGRAKPVEVLALRRELLKKYR